MNGRDLKAKYINFFVSQGHIEIPSASLVPENDPTTLFISAGMHPLVPYLLGQPHPLGKRLTDVQKCVRTGDIDEVGDTFHHTLFEMLGNWSLGDYFKKEMIAFSFEFLTQTLKLPLSKLAVTCFAGDDQAPRDEESAQYWQEQGISPERIAFLPKENNWWGPAGATGPCGPDTEMFYWTGTDPTPAKFDPGNDRWREIWNDVFLQYNKTAGGKYLPLSQKNVDTGMGVERTTAVLSGFEDNYLTVIWQPVIKKITEITGHPYSAADSQRSIRIIADHLKAAVFIIADGVEPSNKELGYVLRRLIRRAIRHGKILGLEQNFTSLIAESVLDNQDNYAGIYPELNANREKIISVLDNEENKFRQTLNLGLQKIQQLINQHHKVTGHQAFDLYQSFGFPLEMIEEELAKNNLTLNREEFDQSKAAHVEQSRTLSAGKFKSGLADHSEIITQYHTATHLLHSALRQVLGTHVQQSGSNITAERLRFDFTHPDKVTPEQLKQIAELVNQKISEKLPVTMAMMPFTAAQAAGALAFFGAKYPGTVSVYTIGNFSREVCTGPHVKNTGELGKFTITKEESAGAGKRRIYAVLS
ncbi:alanine--tRNA ligase [Patescibacteria group bacterium]|nr:alanine--tRNA ligase [Patescibacteria group bacterium]